RGVLLNGVVHGVHPGAAGAVVVDGEPAADVDRVEPGGAEADEFRVDVGELGDGVLELADVAELAADVEVDEAEAVGHARGLELVGRAEDLADVQAELGAHAAGAGPLAGAARGGLDADADLRAHAVALALLEDQVELVLALDDGGDVAPELVREDARLDVLVVLEAVADDREVVPVEP